MKTYKAYDIEYDLDGEEVDLPTEMVLELEDNSEPSLELADAISDKTGWCVRELKYEEQTIAPKI